MLLPQSNRSIVVSLTVLLLCGVLILFMSIKKYGAWFSAHAYGNMTMHAKYHRLYNIYDVTYSIGNQSSSNDQQVVDYIRSQILQPSLTRPLNLARPNKTDQSLVGESALVDKLLPGRRNGFFVECGAADGETQSNSLFFERYRNWTGLLIEGNPVWHGALLNKNRRAYVLKTCLGTERRPTVVRFRNHQFQSGIVGKIHGSLRGRVFKVQCFPMNYVMEALGVSHIDYLSLDVEGPELEILHTVNWSRLHVDVMTIEYRTKSIKATLKKLNDLRQFFHDTGIYHEIGVLPSGDETKGLDVVFSRV